MSSDTSSVDRRAVLASLGALGTASLAGCTAFEPGDDSGTTELGDEQARSLAEQFAPTLYFDEYEQWFPTDPRSYEREQDGEVVVDGFDAFDGYTAAAASSETPPEPTVFYNAVAYDESPLAVIQFWYYSAFDQFATNFHWHDWEVLHVFVDTESGEPQLYVASSHSGRVPNNEFLDPDPGQRPRILSELGSHSSALSVNEIADRFQRLSVEDAFADITNSAIETLEDIANIPIAYGLPRDEGSRFPYVVPELDGAPIYEHDRLPSVDRADLITDALTVRSFSDLTSPPGDLPARGTGLVFGHSEQAADDPDVDVGYELVSTSEVEHITAFTGPQLSFEFSVPQFAEDAVAGHITTAGVPWDQPRYTEPAADITDANHRGALAERYDVIGEPVSVNTVIATVSEAITDDDAPDGEGVTTGTLSTEALVLLESDPEAVPTFGGLAVAQGVPEGDHRLTINAPGVEPHSETVAVADADVDPTTAGVDGEIPLVARENAIKLGVDTTGSADEITRFAVEDDFAGRLYDAPLADSDAVYVHRGGAYTAEVRDRDGEIGAERVNPAAESGIRIENPSTGKGSLAEYLADVAAETSAAVAAVDEEDSDDDDTDDTGASGGGSANAIRGLSQALEAVAEAARRAAERAATGDRERAEQSLRTVQDRLDRVATRLAEASADLPDDLERATDRRLDQSRRRAEQARTAEKL